MRSLNETALVKLRAMHGKMLKEKEYLEMLNCKNVLEIITYLKNNTHYKKSLQNLEEKNVEKEKVKEILKTDALNNKNKIFKYFKESKILKILLKQDEISNFLNHNFNEEQPKKTKTIEKLLNNLKSDEKKLNHFKIEFALYNSYFKKLLKTVKSNSKNIELFELNRLLKTKIELINLCTIYRKKFLIKTPINEIKSEIFPFNKSLNENNLQNILESKTKPELEENFKKFFKKVKIFKIEDVEICSNEIEYIISKHYIHISFNITTVFYCFLVLQKIEILNLAKIIEGISYKMPKEKIKSLLII